MKKAPLKNRSLIFLATVFLLASSIRAQDSQDPTEATRQLLNSPELRNKALNNSAASAADQRVHTLGDRKGQSDNIYNLSADVFGNLAATAHQDPEKMQKLMEQAARDPAGFAATFTPEQQKKLKEIADKLQEPGVRP